MVLMMGGYFLLSGVGSVPEPTATTTSPNPFGNPAGSITPVTTTPTSDSTPLVFRDNSTVVVSNFIPANQPTWANTTSGYLIAGSGEDVYEITFIPQSSYFSIGILAEPLGSNRLLAEQALQQKLRLSVAQICKLSIQVFTSISVNETYAGRDLGLSFCPGATVLPK